MNGKMKTKDTCIAMDIKVKEQPMKPEAMEADLLIVLDGKEWCVLGVLWYITGANIDYVHELFELSAAL